MRHNFTYDLNFFIIVIDQKKLKLTIGKNGVEKMKLEQLSQPVMITIRRKPGDQNVYVNRRFWGRYQNVFQKVSTTSGDLTLNTLNLHTS